jgi:hypothetical protein
VRWGAVLVLAWIVCALSSAPATARITIQFDPYAPVPVCQPYLNNPESVPAGLRVENPDTWLAIQECLGEQLVREFHYWENGAVLMQPAIAAWRNVQSVRTSQSDPLGWAKAEIGIAETLAAQAVLLEGQASKDLNQKAIESYRLALPVLAQGDDRALWAKTLAEFAALLTRVAYDLGSASQEADGQGDPSSLALHREAVIAYELALNVYSKAQTPDEWGATQLALGYAWQAVAHQADSAPNKDALNNALAAFRAALEVSSIAETPERWFDAQSSIGSVIRFLALDAERSQQIALEQQAVAALQAALEVKSFPSRSAYSFDMLPMYRSLAISNLVRILISLAQNTNGAESLSYLDQAETILKQDLQDRLALGSNDQFFDGHRTQFYLGAVYAVRADRTAGAAGLAQWRLSVAAFREALAESRRVNDAVNAGLTQFALGRALRNTGARTGGREGRRLLREAIAELEQAGASVAARDEALVMGSIQEEIALAYSDVFSITGTAQDRQRATEFANRALVYWRSQDEPMDAARIEELISRIEQRHP